MVYALAVIGILFFIQTAGYGDNQPRVAPNQPFQKSFSHVSSLDFTGSFQVPDNKRLVIEYASAYMTTNQQGPVTEDPPTLPEETYTPNRVIYIKTTVNGEVSSHYWLLVNTGGDVMGTTFQQGGSYYYSYIVTKYFTGSQQMRVYADPGSTVEVAMQLFDGCTDEHCHNINLSATLSGYFADLNCSP
jgi:hypothetical protein